MLSRRRPWVHLDVAAEDDKERREPPEGREPPDDCDRDNDDDDGDAPYRRRVRLGVFLG